MAEHALANGVLKTLQEPSVAFLALLQSSEERIPEPETEGGPKGDQDQRKATGSGCCCQEGPADRGVVHLRHEAQLESRYLHRFVGGQNPGP